MYRFIKRILKEYKYVLILGPSNSGKTTHFYENTCQNKYLISAVDGQELKPLNVDDNEWQQVLNKSFLNLNNVDYTKIKQVNNNNVCVYIDEIHFLERKHINALIALLDYIFKNDDNRTTTTKLYICSLTGSYTNNPLPYLNHLVANAFQIIILHGPCHSCKQMTTQSGILLNNNIFNNKELVLGKNIFCAKCKTCSQK